MQDSDQEIVRRVLSSVLDRLGEGARAGSTTAGGDNSIILVVMQQGGNALSASPVSAEPLPDDRARGIDRPEMRATHPVFERFPVAEVESVSLAPKTCFMEPNRVCVNSGACQMRGY